MNTINKWLERFGYYKHRQKFTEDELLIMYVELQDDIAGNSYPEKDRLHMFKDLSKVEGFRNWLRYTANKDLQRYFASTPGKEQDTVRGAMARTVYIQGSLVKINEPTSDSKKGLKISGLRYGK